MTSRTENRPREREGDPGDGLVEVLPGLWITGPELQNILREIDGKTLGLPSESERP